MGSFAFFIGKLHRYNWPYNAKDGAWSDKKVAALLALRCSALSVVLAVPTPPLRAILLELTWEIR
jgi:hypothetical protein